MLFLGALERTLVVGLTSPRIQVWNTLDQFRQYHIRLFGGKVGDPSNLTLVLSARNLQGAACIAALLFFHTKFLGLS